MRRILLWLPFALVTVTAVLTWLAFLIFTPVAVVDANLESAMSLQATNGWSQWTSMSGSATGPNASYTRRAVIQRTFHRIELVQTAKGLDSDSDLDVPRGGGTIRTTPAVIATLGICALLMVAWRLYAHGVKWTMKRAETFRGS
jgi:hypothetical protein